MAFTPSPQLPDLSRLLPVLNNSGIQKSNQPLYQVIKSLLDYIQLIAGQVGSITGGGGGGASLAGQDFVTSEDDTATLPNSRELIGDGTVQVDKGKNGVIIVRTALPMGGDGGEEGGDGPPGPPGPAGANGAPGPAGSNAISFFYGFDAEDGIDGQPGIPGPQGFPGQQGIQGQPGQFGIDGIDGEEGPWYPVPGPQGPPPTFNDFIQTLSPSYSGNFIITTAGLIVNKNVVVVQTIKPIPNKGNATDEFEMDAIELTGLVISTTQIQVSYWCQDIVVGDYAFAWAVSG